MPRIAESSTPENASLVFDEGETEQEISTRLWRTGLSASVLLFLVYLGLGMSTAPLSKLFLERACADHHLGPDDCHDDPMTHDKYVNAQKDLASFMILYSLSNGILSVGTCNFYGVLSDTYGRRVSLLIPQIGQVCSALVIAVFPASWQHTSFLPAVFAVAIMGGTFVENAVAMASLADVTHHVSAKQRSAVFAMVEAMMWVGMLIGPVLGGVLAKKLGNQKCFYVMACLNILNIAITFFTYRETLEKHRRQPFWWQRANPFAAVALFGQKKIAVILGLVFTLGMFGAAGGTSVLGQYEQKIADFDTVQLGASASIGFGASCLGLLVLMPLLTKVLSLPRILSLGFANMIAVYLLLATARTVWEFFLFKALSFGGALLFPVVRVGMINAFGRDRYGEVLSAVGTLEQACTMVGPIMFQSIYHVTVTTEFDVCGITIRSVSMLVASGVVTLGLIVSLLLREIPRNCDWDAERLTDSEILERGSKHCGDKGGIIK
jgi:MFS family permease